MFGETYVRNPGAGTMSGSKRRCGGGLGIAQAALEPSFVQGAVHLVEGRTTREASLKKIIGPDFGLSNKIGRQIPLVLDAGKLVCERLAVPAESSIT
jgi:hypothetical protein